MLDRTESTVKESGHIEQPGVETAATIRFKSSA